MHDIIYKGDNGNEGPSPAIWADDKFAEILKDPNKGVHVFEDFVGFGGSVAANVGTYSGTSGYWKSYEDTGVSFGVAAALNGILSYTGTTTDNLEAAVQLGNAGSAGLFNIVTTAGSDKKLWFEARVRKEVITDTLGGFVGLALVGAPANSFLADGGTDVANTDVVGWFDDDADGDKANFVYKATGQNLTTLLSNGATFVAATWIKLGFIYDPDASASKRLKLYVDGVEQSTYGTSTNLSAATFPSTKYLLPIFAVKQGNNVNNYYQCDWIRCAQLR